MGTDIQALLASANALAAAILPLMSVLSSLAGLYIIAQAARILLKDDQRDGGLPAVGVKLLIGACLVQFGTSIEWTRELFAGAGTEVRVAMAYVLAKETKVWGEIVQAGLLWLATIGVLGMFRGFLLWNKAGSGDSSGGGRDHFWAGLWHIAGGAICINIGT